MKIIRAAWLEILFGLLIAGVLVLGLTGAVHETPLDYGKRLTPADVDMGAVPMDRYLDTIASMDHATALIVVRDVAGFHTTPAIIESLRALGFDQADAFSDSGYQSFIGIWSDGEVVWQQVGGDAAISHGQFIGNHYVLMKSATWSAGNTGEIYIDNLQYAVNYRGFNIVTFDHQAGTLIDSVAYDVYEADIPVYRLIGGQIAKVASTEGE